MKKIILIILTFILTLCITNTAFAARPVLISIGGKNLSPDVKPVMINDRVFVPLRFVFEAIDAKVEYVETEEKIIATKNERCVEFIIGSNVMTINGIPKQLDTAVIIMNDRTMIPLRACIEAFDMEIQWNEQTYTAEIKRKVSLPVEGVENGVIFRYTYDENGNVTFHEKSDGYYEKYEYNESGQETYYENSSGEWRKTEYDKYGIPVYGERHDGQSFTTEYNDDFSVVYQKNSTGIWTKYEYNEFGQKTSHEESSGFYLKNIYDKEGNLIKIETHLSQSDTVISTDDVESKPGYTESRDGDTVTYTYNDGSWEKITYDKKGNKISSENSDGTKNKFIYNESDRCIYSEYSSGAWTKYEYDSEGNKIKEESYYEAPLEMLEKSEYDKYGNIINYEMYTGDTLSFWFKNSCDDTGNIIYYEDSIGNYKRYIVVTK